MTNEERGDADEYLASQFAEGEPQLAEVPGSTIQEMIRSVEDQHFRTEHDTGSCEQAMVVWNTLRISAGLPCIHREDLPKWDGEKYAMPKGSKLLSNNQMKDRDEM